jgi:hypothetical protein
MIEAERPTRAFVEMDSRFNKPNLTSNHTLFRVPMWSRVSTLLCCLIAHNCLALFGPCMQSSGEHTIATWDVDVIKSVML